MGNIFWNVQEKQVFASMVKHLALTRPDLNKTELIDKAMEAIPEHRRRPRSGPLVQEAMAALNGIDIKVKRKRPYHRRAPSAAAVVTHPPATPEPGPETPIPTTPTAPTTDAAKSSSEPEPKEVPTDFKDAYFIGFRAGEEQGKRIRAGEEQGKRESAAPVMEAETPPPPSPGDVIRDSIIEAGAEIVAAILSNVAVREALKGLVSIAIGKQIAPPVVRGDWPAEHVRRNAPKVLVAGLLPIQAERVRQELGKALDLQFWVAGESKDQLRALANNAHEVYGMTGFIRHNHDAIMKDRAKEHYHRIASGPSGLIRALKERFAKEIGANELQTH